MKNLSIKILLACVFACVCAASVSAQCPADEKKAEELRKNHLKVIYKKAGDDLEKYYAKEIAQNPTCFWLYGDLGFRRMTERKYDEALVLIKKAEELLPLTPSSASNFEVKYYSEPGGVLEKYYASVGDASIKEQNFNRCIDSYSHALKYTRRNHYILGRADCLYNSEQFDAAAEDYLSALELIRSTNLNGLKTVTYILANLPKITRREKFLTESCRLKLKNNDFDGADADCNEALKIDPNLAEAKQLFAEARAAGSKKKAEDERKKAEERRIAAMSPEEREQLEQAPIKEELRLSNPAKYEFFRRIIVDKNPDDMATAIAKPSGFICFDCTKPEGSSFGDPYYLWMYHEFMEHELKFSFINGDTYMDLTRKVKTLFAVNYDKSRTEIEAKTTIRYKVNKQAGTDTFGLSLVSSRTYKDLVLENDLLQKTYAEFCRCRIWGIVDPVSETASSDIEGLRKVKFLKLDWNGRIHLIVDGATGSHIYKAYI